MTRSNAAHEPSMDEILASIRRIIETGDERIEVDEAGRARPERSPIVERLGGWDEGSGNVVARLTPEPASDLQAPMAGDEPSDEGDPDEGPSAAGLAEPQASVPAPEPTLEEEEDDLAIRLREELAEEDFIDWSALDAAIADEADVEIRAGESEADIAAETARADGDTHGTGQTAVHEPSAAPIGSLETKGGSEDRAAAAAADEDAGSVPADLPFRAANTDSRRMQDFRAAILDDASDPRHPDDAPLTSGRTGELVGASFDQLAEAIREGQLRSMEEMAQDLLRPMLQDWLDDNLPKLVERLVREEIERVARGGRR